MKKPKRPKMRHAASAGDLLDQLFEGLGLNERLDQCRPLVVWNEVVGEQIARHTRPLRMREGILEVTVAQPVWMQQLQLMKPQIMKRLNDRLGDDSVKDIFLKRGRLSTRPQEVPSPPPIWKTVTLDQTETERLSALLSEIKDPELRAELQEFLLKQARLAKARKLD